MKKFRLFILAAAALAIVGCDGGLSQDVYHKTMTAENAIDNYEYFKTQERAIRAKYQDEVIATEAVTRYKAMLPQDMSQWASADRFEVQRLETIKDGIKYTVNSMVAEYEAKASMKHKALFQNNLPTNIFRGTNQVLEFKYSMPNVMGSN
ncbi:MAG: hypothetical protein ACRDCE_04610 [Cetobacterium sp.]|uniref:hypothetical protein n=1 Tax=Cetobacterium sp. TaxID=2071632 RepID=UPI003EE802C5